MSDRILFIDSIGFFRTIKDIINILDVMVARGSGGAANNAYAAISKFFNWCASRDLITASPCIGVERPSKKNSRDRVLSDSETSAVWSAASEVGFPFGNIVQLLMLTAQRRGEVATMERDHIDWDERIWHIPEELTKNSRPHAVPLSPYVLSIIEAVPMLHARFFFPARGSTTTCFSGFGRSKERLDKELSIKPWILHDLRRTTATGMAGLGIQPHIVERVLNHSTGQLGGVAAVYNRFQYIDEMRDALEKWSEHVLSLQS